jgi:hypothetical protein
MIKLTLENIQKLLQEKGANVQSQKETGQLYIILKISDTDFPLFIRLYESEDLLQLLLFIPCNIQEGAEGEIARLLHTLNKEIDVPGFGMDETSKVVFYRVMVPAFHNQIEEELIDVYYQSLPNIASTFGGVISAVATGNATYKEVMKKVNEAQAKS